MNACDKKQIKAIALVSTGLDSLLAASIVRDLGVQVHGITFGFSFDLLNERHIRGEVEALLRPLGIPWEYVDLSEAILPILKKPPHGFGSCVNPCIDCHLLMIRQAAAMMERLGASFIVTGEVVGQRPMSQNKPVLLHIDKASGMAGRILRPLSAKLLKPTLAEEMGWVDREKLYAINGRSRKEQIRLAEERGIRGYGTPAGGCILTDPEFAKRVRSFFDRMGQEALTEADLRLMRIGRHFWPGGDLRVIVGRNEKDNGLLERFEGFWRFFPEDLKGPLVLASGIRGPEDMILVSRITARYCGRRRVRVRHEGESSGVLEADPVTDPELDSWRV